MARLLADHTSFPAQVDVETLLRRMNANTILKGKHDNKKYQTARKLKGKIVEIRNKYGEFIHSNVLKDQQIRFPLFFWATR